MCVGRAGSISEVSRLCWYVKKRLKDSKKKVNRQLKES